MLKNVAYLIFHQLFYLAKEKVDQSLSLYPRIVSKKFKATVISCLF